MCRPACLRVLTESRPLQKLDNPNVYVGIVWVLIKLIDELLKFVVVICSGLARTVARLVFMIGIVALLAFAQYSFMGLR